MISTTGYYAPEAVTDRLRRVRTRAKKLEDLTSSIATHKKEKAASLARKRRQRYQEVAQLFEQGLNWRQIGEKLGVTRQGAHHIYKTGGRGSQKEAA